MNPDELVAFHDDPRGVPLHDDDLATLIFKIEDEGLAAAVEQYPHLFAAVDENLGELAWEAAAALHVLKKSVATVTGISEAML